MAALSATRRNALLLVVLLFAQLLLMSTSVTGGQGATLLEAWTVRLSSPVIGVSEWIGGSLRGALEGGRRLLGAHERNAVLEEQVKRLELDLQRYREAALENTRLRRALSMREELVPNAVAASVVTSNLGRQDRVIVVDRGTRHGVLPDMPVIAWGGAVGKVETAFERHAKIRLLTDPNSGVAGVVQRSRAQGMVFGKDGRLLELLYVPRFSDVTVGDRVVTSGLEGIFPRGFGVGRVVSMHQSAAGMQTIRLEPELDFRSLEEVMVLIDPVGSGLLSDPEPVRRQ